MKIAIFALGLASLAGATLAAESPLQEVSAPAAVPSCIYPTQIRSSTPISDREILFRMNNGKIWKNTLRSDCPGLKFEAGFSWNIRGDTVCANLQTIYVLRRGTACLLGEFSAYTPPPKPAP